MKNLFIAFALSSFYSLISQDISFPLIQDEPVWNVYGTENLALGFDDRILTYRGDTNVCDKAYSITSKSYVFRQGNEVLIRRDGEKVFWRYPFTDCETQEDQLMYDFGLQAGDSINSDTVKYMGEPYKASTLHVESVYDTVLFNQAKKVLKIYVRNYWFDDNTYYDSDYRYWIRGIGDLEHPFNTHMFSSPSLMESVYYLRCAQLKGKQTYQNPDFETCGFNVGVDERQNKAISLFPNPASNVVNVEVNQNTSLLVYNVIGQQIDNIELISGANKIDISTWPASLYTFVLNQNGSITKQRLLVR